MDTIRKVLLDLRRIYITRVCRDSIAIEDEEIVTTFLSDISNTVLVSFPRTGSHWLRMLMELYFQRPSLVRIFYYPNCRNYLTYHTHDIRLDFEHPQIIYLYRDPIDTIFSQLQYHYEPVDDLERIQYWSDLYGRHLEKWLERETFTIKKTIISYEGMRRDLSQEFEKIPDHFGQSLDLNRFNLVANKVTKTEVDRKTEHDSQVIQLHHSYISTRYEFRRKFGEIVNNNVFGERSFLFDYFV